MPELGTEARRAIDRHLDSVGDHLVAVMWELAFAIVRSSEQRAEAARPPGVDNLVDRLRSEAERITEDLTALRARGAAPAPVPASAPAPPADVTWTPADGLSPEPIEDEPDDGPEPAELPEPAPEPEPPEAAPAPRGRRASMHDNPVWSLFHRTESGGSGEADEPRETKTADRPPERQEPDAGARGNKRLMELARAVELAGGAPPRRDEDPA